MPPDRPRHGVARLARVPLIWQVVVVVVVLALWQWFPDIPGIRGVITFADPFFISSPLRCAKEIEHLFFGGAELPIIWSSLGRTLVTSLVGTAAAVVVGCALGLVCSNWVTLNSVVRPFLVLFNALPKVALVPVIVLIAGATASADAVVAFLTVLFIVFFNAFEGGSSVKQQVLDNAKILGASPLDRMFKIRWPFALAWTFAVMPNAIAFGLVGTVTAELFTGSSGIGAILITAVDTANADLTFAVVVILAVVGVILVVGTDQVRRKVLHWW
jgi:NitT/TauT family transport system permease protein